MVDVSREQLNDDTKYKDADDKINKMGDDIKKLESIRFKLLLLGAGESGKSTLLKQMRKLHGQQYETSELIAVKPHLTQNVIEAMRVLAIYSELLSDQKKDTKVKDENQEIRDRVARMSDKQAFTQEHYKDFIKLWQDPGIQKTLDYRPQYQLIDTYQYLFSRMSEFWKPDFVPTFEDYIHCRQRTTGVNRIKFLLKSAKDESISEIYEIFDVGGQKNERRKWIHFFDNTTAILFVAALSGYNQLLWEDQKNNRMREAIGLFRGIVNLPAFKDSHIILFLNKVDLFQERIKKFPVNQYFKSYKKDINNASEIIEFFKLKFLAQRKGETKNKEVYTHVTHATDTKCVQKIFSCVRDVVVTRELENQGFL